MGSSPHPTASNQAFDVESVRREFPVLHQRVYGKNLVYLDNAATSQKPQSVLDAVARYYEQDNANVHRGVHALSGRATTAYESVRARVQELLGAGSDREVVFVRGTTEAINLVANTFARARVAEGDEIIITAMEHHSNIVPWQMLCETTGAKLRVAPMNKAGDLLLDEYEKLFSPRTKMAALSHVSNAIGTVNPVEEMIAIARKHGVPVLLDGAQAVPHIPVDVRALDCDFYAFSGHKSYGPTGIGALYAKAEHLESMPPYQGGGDMIAAVSFEKTTYNDVPHKFEAGTPNVAGTVGLGAAIDFIESVGYANMMAHEDDVVAYAVEAIGAAPGVTLIGTPRRRAGVVSFMIDGAHPHDAGTIIDRQGIAIRAGHHCSQPLMQFYGVPATCRASFAVYNTREEVDRLVSAIAKVREVFA